MAEPTKITDAIPTREDRIAALPPLPERSRYAYNRRAEPWEAQFNGRVYAFQPYECKTLPSEIAEHFRAHSIIPGTLRKKVGGGGTLTAERAIALGPGWLITGSVKVDDEFVLQYAEAEPDADFFVESTTVPGHELWDRSSIPNYVERPNVREGDQGKATHAVILPV